MRLRTINEAAALLDVSARHLRRGIREGRYAYIQVGNRQIVDVDELGPIIETERATVGIREAMALTGLSEATIRRAVRAGRLPAVRLRSGYAFVPAQLIAAVEAMKRKE